MELTVEDLKEALINFSIIQSQGLTENCIVALEDQNHKSGCILKLSGDFKEDLKVNWSSEIIKNGYKESKKFTEKGAEAISFFIAVKYTDYDILEEATIGTGIDYWLDYKSNHEDYDELNMFRARLEVSGILKETSKNTFHQRINIKKEQTKASDYTMLPAFVSIVEFSEPKVYFSKK